MFWALVQRLGREGTALVIFIILAMLLSPQDFGLLGMCYVWIGFIKLFSDLGFPAALIQKKDATVYHYSSIFYFNIFIGIILTLMGIALSWPCAFFFKDRNIQPLMAILAVCFFFDSFATVPKIILQKELKFKELAIRDISASLIGGGLGIISAMYNLQVWSLVIQSVSASCIGTILIWYISKWKPKLAEFSIKYIKELWDYGSKILTGEVFKYLTQNYDRLLIGYLGGANILGLYTFAYKFAVYPGKELIKGVDAYLFPKFSLLQDNLNSLKQNYLFLLRAGNSIFAPLSVTIIFSAPILIPQIFGLKWNSAVVLIQILSFTGWSYLIISPVAVLMKVLNRPVWVLIWMIIFVVVASLLIWLGSMHSVRGSVLGLTLTYFFGTLASLLIAQKLLNLQFNLIIRQLYPSTIASLVSGTLMWLIFKTINLNNNLFPAAVNLGFPLLILLGCTLVYVGLINRLNPGIFKNIRDIILKSV